MAIAILIKNTVHDGPADIQYRDIGDYLTREQKLDILSIEQSLEGTEWEAVAPNDHGDWINHRDERYDTFQPIGDKSTKGKLNTPGIFENYSSGIKTNRDAWCYNYSRAEVERNMSRSIEFYNDQVSSFQDRLKEDLDARVEDHVDMISTKFTWDRVNKSDARKGKRGVFEPGKMRLASYRPFTKQWLYFDETNQFNNCVYQVPKIFPTPTHHNLAISLMGVGATRNHSCLIVNATPDLQLQFNSQIFSLYTYEPVIVEAQGGLFDELNSEVVDGYRRKENITDATLSSYRHFYDEYKIDKEDIFFYVYGLLHSPTYKEKYKADLMKMLPRIPKSHDFWGFSKAGRALAELHLDYETADPYPLQEIATSTVADEYEFYEVQKLSFASRKDRSKIIYNAHISLAGIPEEAYDYQVNGKSALEWILDRYQVTTHKESRIINNPNDYSRDVGNPRYIIDMIKRIVTVSVETNRIVAALPPLEIAELG